MSVVIAARNEELDLPATLDRLLAQDYPNLEVVVVDGGSTDGTRGVIDARAPRVRLVDEPPLPPDGSARTGRAGPGRARPGASGSYSSTPTCASMPATRPDRVGWAERERRRPRDASLPEIEMAASGSGAVLPFYIQMVLTYFRAPHVNRSSSRTAMANGQFCLVRRAEYEALGRPRRDPIHRARGRGARPEVPGRRAGRSRVALGPDLVRTRMYRDRAEMFEGLLKNVHGTEFSAARQVGFLVGLVGLFWLPLAVLPLGLLTGDYLATAFGALLAFALFAKHVVFARAGTRSRRLRTLVPPRGRVLRGGRGLVPRHGLRGGTVGWKGRSYPDPTARCLPNR